MNFLPSVHLGNKWNYFSQFICLPLSLCFSILSSFLSPSKDRRKVKSMKSWRNQCDEKKCHGVDRESECVLLSLSLPRSLSSSLSLSLTLFFYGWGEEKTSPVSGKILVLLGSNFSTKTGAWREWEKETQKCDICFVSGKNQSVNEGERERESEEKGGEERESWSQVPNTF